MKPTTPSLGSPAEEKKESLMKVAVLLTAFKLNSMIIHRPLIDWISWNMFSAPYSIYSCHSVQMGFACEQLPVCMSDVDQKINWETS